MSAPNPVLKIILLGDSGVGKSSLINRFVKNEFNEEHFRTLTQPLHVLNACSKNKKKEKYSNNRSGSVHKGY